MLKILLLLVILFGSINFALAASPDAPYIHSIKPEDNKITLFWDRPDAHPRVFDYKIEYHDGDLDWKLHHDGVTANLFTIISNLDENKLYFFRVIAINSDGESEPSNIVSAVASLPTRPSEPLNLQATAEDNKVTLQWDPPLKQQLRVDDYIIEYRKGNGSWKVYDDGKNTHTNITISGLDNDALHSFRVKATTGVGEGNYSDLVSVWPGAVPDPPANLTILAELNQVRLSWTAPYTGGPPITFYIVQYISATSTFYSTMHKDTSILLDNLEGGVKYNFRVFAVNSIGPSEPSLISATPISSAKSPDPPTNLSYTPRVASITLSWTAPNDGGSPITDYIIQWRTSGDWQTFADGTNTKTTLLVSGLANGTTYKFRVLAVNAAGNSVPSSILLATPGLSAPGVPTNLLLLPGNGEITVLWDAPESGSSPITHYIIKYRTGSTWSTSAYVTSVDTSITITNLTNDISYFFTVSAVNSDGTGKPSKTVTAMPLSTLN